MRTLNASLLVITILAGSTAPVISQARPDTKNKTRASLSTTTKVAKPEPKKAATTPAKPAAAPETSNFTIDPAVSVVILRMSHSITGRFETSGKSALNGKFEINPQGRIVGKRLEFKPDSFESLIALRDEHIKKQYLETSKYPVIALENIVTELGRFEGTIQGEGKEEKGSAHEKPFSAELIVKGVRIPVKGRATVFLENEVLKGHVEFEANISSFPIKPPKYMGVGVLDEFTLLVDFYARPDISEDEAIGSGNI